MNNFGTKLTGNKLATVGDDIGVIRGTLGYHALFKHPRIIGSGRLGHHFPHRRVQELNGLDIAAPPADILGHGDSGGVIPVNACGNHLQGGDPAAEQLPGAVLGIEQQDVARARGSVLGVVFGALVWILATGVVACCRAVI